MSMWIYEAGSDDQVGGIDYPIRTLANLPDFRDAVTGDRDIGAHAGSAGAVDHGAVFDQKVIGHNGFLFQMTPCEAKLRRGRSIEFSFTGLYHLPRRGRFGFTG